MRSGPLIISVAPASKSVENVTMVVVCCWPFGSLWFSRLSEYVIGHCSFGIRAYKRNAKVPKAVKPWVWVFGLRV